VVSYVEKERAELGKERAEAKSIGESEKLLNKRLVELKGMMNAIEKRVGDEDASIKNSELHIERLNALINQVKQHVEEEKLVIEPLVERSKEQEKKILELQDRIVKKISQKQKSISNVKEVTNKVRNFLDKKLAVVNLVDKINKDRDELEKTLIELIKKAKSFQLSARSGDVGKEMLDLEKKFDEVDKKRSQFASELKELTSFTKR
jgi:chromosome segregation ATPase